MELVIFSILLLLLLLPFLLFRGRKGSNRLPPGSLGLPVIGHSLSLLKAMKADKVNEWFHEGVRKYGPVWKTNLFGYQTVVLHGTAANKFVYTCDWNILANTQPPSISRILGEKNIIELSGPDHKRVRAALTSFLKPEVLKQYVGKIDEEIRHNLEMHWHGKTEVKVQPLMKSITFNVICSLLFGIRRGIKRDKVLPVITDMLAGVLAVPVNLPFTKFNRGLRAREKIKGMLLDLINEKRVAMEVQGASTHKDLFTSLLSIRDEDNLRSLSDEEIMDNIILVMIAGYDTTSVLLTCMVRLLATDQSVHSAILHEHEEIAKIKASGEPLTWDDLTKMKYTWTVATETLRMYPPVGLTFRRAIQDIEYGGYIIPKGWQVAISQGMTHMENSIFPDPTTFDPARFDQQAPSPPPFSFIPFGGGPRMCPGFEFAKMECLAVIHRLVTQFKWELLLKDSPFIRAPMPEFHQGMPVKLAPK